MMDENIYPENWKICTLSDILLNPQTDLVDGPFGSNLKSEDFVSKGVPVFKIQNIKANRFVDKKIDFVTSIKADELKRHSFKSGDLIITKLGDPLGLCCFVPEKYSQGIIVADLLRLRVNDSYTYSRYILYLINSSVIQNQFQQITKGTTRPRVNLGIVRNINLPLPPLLEQHRIVAKIEELFSELEKGIETLKTAQQQLKVYRQAVLKYAFEGKLTNPDLKEGELPLGWIQCELNDLSKLINGDRGKNYPNRSEYVSVGIPFINTGHILPNGKLDMSSMNYISREKFNSLSSGKVKSGDLVYCLRGATMGKTAIIDQFSEGAIASSLVVIRLNEKVLNKFIYYFLLCPYGKGFIKIFDNGTAQPNLSAKSLSMFSIPLPPLNEQELIVQEIESRLSVCDKIEESIEQGLQQAEALRQSILKKAFEGKLVPQDPKDEPASVLLERIKNERASAQSEKKTRTKKVKV